MSAPSLCRRCAAGKRDCATPYRLTCAQARAIYERGIADGIARARASFVGMAQQAHGMYVLPLAAYAGVFVSPPAIERGGHAP